MKRILVAPLNWGLGHATRCIPIIKALIEFNFEPVIASDGLALNLLTKEFPHLEVIKLPSYEISYSKKGGGLKRKLLYDSPKIVKAINAENRLIDGLIKSTKIEGIISDNRLGVYNKKVPSVYITHQLNVLSGNTTWFSSKLHRRTIKKFDICWVPDVLNEPSLSGKLGHLNKSSLSIEYLGILSRFKKFECDKKYDLLIILSGPEPQRSIFESNLLEQLNNFHGSALFVRGNVELEQNVEIKGNLTMVNFMKSDELEMAMNQSELIVARSGYTTILDLAKLNKKAFFVPTPGQFEQEYLAEHLDNLGIAPFSKQSKFSFDLLNKINDYSGFEIEQTSQNYNQLFSLF